VGTFKVNFDAAINSNAGYVGVGLVARDFMGHLKAAKRLSFHVLTDAYNAELMAAFQAVIFCNQASFLNVIFEGDALKVIKDVNSPPPYLSRSGHLLEGLKQEVGNLNFYSFVHVERNCNEAAHILAKS
jgi:ribonuclease HI